MLAIDRGGGMGKFLPPASGYSHGDRRWYDRAMQKKLGVGLVLVGMVLGCGAAATLPASFAEPADGEWACYNATFFRRDFSAAEAAKAVENVTKAMNAVARHVPAGTTFNTLESVVCVKH